MVRLYEAFRAADRSTALVDVAAVLDEKSSQTIKNWEYRGISQRGLNKAQSKVGINSQWLESGDGPMFHQRHDNDASFLVSEAGRQGFAFENVDDAPARGRVPLISWIQAGSFSDVQDFYQPGEADEWVTAYHSSPSRHAFALRVDGDSMTAPTGRSFPDGCVIVVDPLRGPKHGDYVVAKNTATQKATFKQLTSDGLLSYLKPLNPAYPTVEIDDHKIVIVGVVIEWYMGGRI